MRHQRTLWPIGLFCVVVACGGEDAEFSAYRLERALGAAYHVASNGNDGNPGTAERPWRTLQRAVNSAVPGDTIIVDEGQYAGARIESSGTSVAPIHLRARAGTRPRLTAPGPRNRHSSILEVENFSTRVSHWIIDGFEVVGSPRAGIDLRNTDYVTVRNCWVRNSGGGGRATGIFLAFSNYPTIQDNDSSYNTEHGIYQSNSGDSATIVGNRLHHNHGSGIHLNGDASYGGDGLVSDVWIEGNVIYENGAVAGGSAINMDGVTDSSLVNNLLYANHASGISLFQEDGAQASSRNFIQHNTIVQATGSRWPINIASAAARGNVLLNNIIHHPDQRRGAVLIASPNTPGFVSDYNVVVGRFSADGQASVSSLSQWQNLGFDRHSIVASPAQLFVNPANANYSLLATAPAVDRAIALADIVDDLAGSLRPQGNGPDVGAFEFLSPTVTPPSPQPATDQAADCENVDGGEWTARRFIAASGTVTRDWVVTPTGSGIDAALALSSGAPSRWTDLAAIVRFNPLGVIDVRSGSTYRADRALTYQRGVSYAIRIVADVTGKQYSAFVTPAGGPAIELAHNYPFRTEQSTVSLLDHAVVATDGGGLDVCW